MICLAQCLMTGCGNFLQSPYSKCQRQVVLSGQGNEPLAFVSISSLTGLMVKQSSGFTVSPFCCPGPGRLRLLSAPQVFKLTPPPPVLTFAKALMSPISVH